MIVFVATGNKSWRPPPRSAPTELRRPRSCCSLATLHAYAGLFADDLDAVADQLDRTFAKTNADQARSNRRLEQQRQAVLPFESPPEHAATY